MSRLMSQRPIQFSYPQGARRRRSWTRPVETPPPQDGATHVPDPLALLTEAINHFKTRGDLGSLARALKLAKPGLEAHLAHKLSRRERNAFAHALEELRGKFESVGLTNLIKSGEDGGLANPVRCFVRLSGRIERYRQQKAASRLVQLRSARRSASNERGLPTRRSATNRQEGLATDTHPVVCDELPLGGWVLPGT